MSRINIEVNDTFLKELVAHSYIGMSHSMIAAYYGLENKEWAILRKKNSIIDLKFNEGLAKGNAFVLKHLMYLIKDKNFPAIKLYLEMVAKMSVDPQIDETQPRKSDTVTLGTRDPIEASRKYQMIMQLKPVDG